jgi:hypothetical protein
VLIVALGAASAFSDEGIGHRTLEVGLEAVTALEDQFSVKHGRPLMREEVGPDLSRKHAAGLHSTVQMLPSGHVLIATGGNGLDSTEAPTTTANSASDTLNSAVNAAQQMRNVTNKTAAEVVGVKQNTASDTPAFIGALSFNFIVFAIFLLSFSCLRERVPQVYMNNARSEEEGGLGSAPFRPEPGILGWMRASLRCTGEQAEDASGLDIAQLIEILNFSLKTLIVLAAPLVCILCPLHFSFGGAGYTDFLTTTSMANVVEGSWLYWVHALTVWYVIVVVQRIAYKAQEDFLPRRFKWLKTLPRPTSSTVMVEGIPPRYCSESALRKYFSEMFPGNTIETAHVAMHTEELTRLMQGLHEEQLALERAEHAANRIEGGASADRNIEHQEALQPYEQAVQEKKAEVEQKRAELLEKAEAVDRLLLRQLQSSEKGLDEPLTANEEQMLRNTVYSQAGFVTFKDEREAMLMLHMQCTEDALEFVMSAPPDPADVIYKDLFRGPKQQAALVLIGYSILFSICLVSVPMVTAIAYFTQIDVLKEKFQFIKEATKQSPGLEHMLKGLLASLAITIWNSFMPTLIMLVLYSFFPLRANAWAQVKLQGFYFWIQAIFTILVTAVGSSPAARLEQLVESPLSVFGLLAESLPYSTNFYFNWITLQWSLVGMDLIRYMVLIKYNVMSRVFADDVAIELAEPEDTDFYGLGGRSARFNILLAVALVFSTLSPLILVLSVIDVCLRRLVYGYLLVFAETRKPDLGGVSWVLSLQQIQQSLVIYWILMIGVLNHHADGPGPMLLAAPSLLFGIYTYWRFQTGLRWQSLPFHWVCSDKYLEKSESRKVREASRDSFIQDELRPPNELPSRSRAGVRGAALAVHRLIAVQFRRRRASYAGNNFDQPSSSSAAATTSADPFLVD